MRQATDAKSTVLVIIRHLVGYVGPKEISYAKEQSAVVPDLACSEHITLSFEK
jgi:hypothetical protein